MILCTGAFRDSPLTQREALSSRCSQVLKICRFVCPWDRNAVNSTGAPSRLSTPSPSSSYQFTIHDHQPAHRKQFAVKKQSSFRVGTQNEWVSGWWVVGVVCAANRYRGHWKEGEGGRLKPSAPARVGAQKPALMKVKRLWDIEDNSEHNLYMSVDHTVHFIRGNPGFCDRISGLVVKVPGYRSRGSGLDSLRYQIFWEVVGLVRGPLSLVSTIEELLGRKSSGSGLEIREYGRGDSLCRPCYILFP
jgi:hypothetical protein